MDDREGPGGTDSSGERDSQRAVRHHQTSERQGTEEGGGNHQKRMVIKFLKSKQEKQARSKEHFEWS